MNSYYVLLKDKVYLMLLAFYNNKKMPTYEQLGQEIGLSRQTVSSRIKKLINDNIIIQDEKKIIVVANPLNIDIDILKNYLLEHNDDFNAIELNKVLFNVNNVPKNQIGKTLQMARGTIYKKQRQVVYGIVDDKGVLKYVGTTDYFNERMSQHIKKKPFLTQNNFIILADNVGNNKYDIENLFITILKPEWNTEF